MNKITGWIKLTSAVLITGLLVAACLPLQTAANNSPAANKGKTGPILIGGALCATGQLSFADGAALQGAQLAVDDLNQNGGVLGRKVEFNNLDCKSDPVNAANVTNQLIQQGALAIITPGDYYFGAPSSREAQSAGIVGLSTTASSSLFGSTVLGDKQFTLSMWNNTMGAAAAEYAYKTRGWRSVDVITEAEQDYTVSLSRYFTEAFKNLGGVVLYDDTFRTGAPEFSAQLAHIQALPKLPDFLFISTGQPALSKIIQTLRDAGINLPVVGGDSYDDPDLVKSLGAKYGSEIYYVTHTFLAPGVTPGMAHFLQVYKTKYQHDPIGLVAPGWDAIMILAQAMEKAGSTDGAAMARAMETNEFSLLTGKLRWSAADQGHQPNIEAAMVMIDHDALTFVGWIHPSYTPAP